VVRLRTALIAVASLVGLLLLAIWQVPQWLDWTSYRATIESVASATLGQRVSIGGPVSLTLLPQPVLTASDVSVGSGEANLSMHVNALRLRIAFWPLLGGRVDAQDLVLRSPDLRIPWPAKGNVVHPRAPPWLAAFKARIEDGRLTIGRLLLTGIDADLATLDTGAVSASGSAKLGGQQGHFTARLTAVGADGAAGLDATLDGLGKASGLGASFSGQVAFDGTLAGVVKTRGPDLAVLLPAPAVPFRADGRLSVGNGLVAISELALELDGSPASGEVALHITPTQRLDISLEAGRLALKDWLPVLLPTGTTIAGMAIPIAVEVAAASAPFGDGTLEQVHGAFELTGHDLIVHDIRARLPGNASLKLSGRFARAEPTNSRFEGDARLDAPVLRSTLRWADQSFPGMLPRLLMGLPDTVGQRAGLSAQVVADDGEITLRQIAGNVDNMSVSGSLGFKRGEPPAVTANLSLDRLVLDPWMGARLPSGIDAELQLDIAHASLGGAPINGLSVDAAVEAGNLRLRHLEGRALGTHFSASGMLADTGALSQGAVHIDTENAAGVARLLPLFWQATPALWLGPARLDVQLAGPPEALAAEVKLSLADARLEANSVLNFKTGEWSSTLALRHPGARRLVASLGLPGSESLHRLPEWLGDGSLSLTAHISGKPDQFTARQIDLTAATLHADGELTLDMRGVVPVVSGRLGIDSITPPTPSGGSDVPLPFGLLHGWRGDIQLSVGHFAEPAGLPIRNASARLMLANDTLNLEQFQAMAGTGRVAGSAMLDAGAKPPQLHLQLSLIGAAIAGPIWDSPIDLLSGQANASLNVVASGYSPSAMLATLEGHAAVSVHDGVLTGFDLFQLKHVIEEVDVKAAQANAEAALESGSTGFDHVAITARIAHGSLTIGAGDMTSAAGAAHIDGNLDFGNRVLDVRVRLQPSLPNPPDLAIHLSGSFDRPSRVEELADLARWMAALAH
jgi:uncharacterized protein involved in outer membrane biogenesis